MDLAMYLQKDTPFGRATHNSSRLLRIMNLTTTYPKSLSWPGVVGQCSEIGRPGKTIDKDLWLV